jgi:hypothetical protein
MPHEGDSASSVPLSSAAEERFRYRLATAVYPKCSARLGHRFRLPSKPWIPFNPAGIAFTFSE